MQQHRQATSTKQDSFVISSDQEPSNGPEIHGTTGSNEEGHLDLEPSHDNGSDIRGEEHCSYDGCYEIRRYDSQEEDKDSRSSLTITHPGAHNTDQEVINNNAADHDSPVNIPHTRHPFLIPLPKPLANNFKLPYRVESSGRITHTNYTRPATPTSEPCSFAVEASQTSPSQAGTTNRLETTAELTSPCSLSSSFRPILYPGFIRGAEQVGDKDISVILEEREKQIADEGNDHEQQFAELRRKLIDHFEGFLEVRRQLQELQAKALDRAKRAEKVEWLREELRLLDSELCPD